MPHTHKPGHPFSTDPAYSEPDDRGGPRETVSASLTRFLWDNWPHLLAAAIGSAFSLGVGWAVLGGRITAIERRQDVIDQANVTQTKWRVDALEVQAKADREQSDRTAAHVASIDSKVTGLDAKVDFLVNAARRENKP